jgi:hypothetical protein
MDNMVVVGRLSGRKLDFMLYEAILRKQGIHGSNLLKGGKILLNPKQNPRICV